MTTAWNPLVRDGWKRLRDLAGPTPTKGEVYAWLHSLVEFGVYNSGKESLALDLAAFGFDPEHMARILSELERLGDIMTAGGSLYVPSCLVNTCAAPYSQTQIPRIRNLAAGLPGPLLAVWKRDLLDVTARADEERAKRRRGVKESMFERVKAVLGVTLYPVPESTQEPDAQLAWSFDSPPSLNVVAVRTPAEAAAQPAPGCVPDTPLMADRGDRLLGERRQGVSGSDRYAAQPALMCGVQAEGAPRGLHGHREGFGVGQTGAQRLTEAHQTGDRSISLHGSAGCGGRGNRSATLAKFEGDDASARLDTGADDLDEQALCMLALIGDDDGRDTRAGRAMAAQGKNPAAALQHDSAREARGRASGAGVSADRDRGGRGLAAGRGGQAGAAPSAAGAVPAVVRSGAAGEAESPLDRFIRHSRIDGVARILRSPVIADAEREQMLFDDAVRRTGATQAEQDEMARIAQETFPWWERGIALDALCRPIGWSNKNDRFAELWNKARTPAMKPRVRGGLPQPALSERDDLDDLFGDPRRSAG